MIRYLLAVFTFSVSFSWAQTPGAVIEKGSAAPSFLMNLKDGSVQSFSMPHQNKIVLLCFWSTSMSGSKVAIANANYLAKRYKDAIFTLAESFEVIGIAVQSDKKSWAETVLADSLNAITHGIAVRGYQEEVCKRYLIKELPTLILIDEKGIIQAINPRFSDIEVFLDSRKNSLTLRTDLSGALAQSSNKREPIPYCKLFLFNHYGDSLQVTTTTNKGSFVFPDVKINQDLYLKIDNKVDIITSDPIALYSPAGEFIMDGRTGNKGFEFAVPSRSAQKLTMTDSAAMVNYLGQIEIIKHLTFYTNGEGLTPQDEKDLGSILKLLLTNKDLKLEITVHTDSRMDSKYAMSLTANQAQAIKSYLEKKGIPQSRLKIVAKGNSVLRKNCESADCKEEDHQLNRRVEFLFYRN